MPGKAILQSRTYQEITDIKTIAVHPLNLPPSRPRRLFRRALPVIATAILLATPILAVPPPSLVPSTLDRTPVLDSLAGEEPRVTRTPAVGSGGNIFALCEVQEYQPDAPYGGSDCWGWQAPDGREYAIMGVAAGIAFVNVTDGYVADIVPGPTSGCGTVFWRDMVNYGQYLYCVSECVGLNEGLMIIDMQYLPDSVHLVTAYKPPSGGRTSHNLSIDTAKGFAYIVRPGYNGFRVVDLSNPVAPVELPAVTTPDIHDVFARNDTVWVAEGFARSFSVWNMADKQNPQLIVRVSVPNGGYVHNIWPTGDGRHVVTTEETANQTIKVWNVEDYQNVSLVAQFLGPSGLAHNAQCEGDTVFVSHYESGIVVFDITNPTTPLQLARYDTWASGEQPEFNGAWGVFPHTASGKVYGSNLDGRLFVLERHLYANTDTARADSVTAAPGTLVKVDIILNNAFSAATIDLPVNWDGPLGLLFDSISTAGLRTDYFEIQLRGADFSHNRAAWRLYAPAGQPELPPGNGPVASVHFRLPASATGGPNPISLEPIGLVSMAVTNSCFTYQPTVVPGAVTLYSPSGCCEGITGNVNDDPGEIVDIADLTALIDYLFVNFTPLPCLDEANTTGDPSGTVDIADLTALIDHLFINFTPLPACP